jgi:hypothetical protein
MLDVGPNPNLSRHLAIRNQIDQNFIIPMIAILILGYPNPDSNADCTVINSNDGTWTNQACDIPECYICSY